MLYGDLVTLLPNGIQLGDKAMLPIGVFDKSLCWGVWVEDAGPRRKQKKPPHLVVSPLHPRVWPFLLRIELKLREDPGMMAGAAELLADCGLNIQFGESSPSGHSHATWNVVCEAVKVRQVLGPEIETFRYNIEGVPRWRDVNSLATRVAGEMYKTAVDVRAKLKAGGFLHERILKRHPPLLHRPMEVEDQKARDLAKFDYPRAVRIR